MKEKVQLLREVCMNNGNLALGAGMLLPILSYRFIGDAQAAIEAFERCVREYAGQSTHVVPDPVKAVIVVNGIEE